jgi:hypothetical protein
MLVHVVVVVGDSDNKLDENGEELVAAVAKGDRVATKE